MASNKDLIKQATEIAAELDIRINTSGLNNAKLAALVSDLKAKQRDAGLDTQADTAPVAAEHEVGETGAALLEEAATEPAAPAFPFSVAPGKALTTKRGVLGEGEEIKAEDIAGDGPANLKALVKAGFVAEAKG